ncbi:hypothetical protein BIFGAL_04418 [Bifidobacterium gallicum DSM 20093 = LMG 11596]|uniref:Uncharacterized protein n=1 Tax=Bifidobacterium gallicum DSM 20093 = LMG 11596 TaxID=561180 RepID=D1NX10_9BIFI|nr:hypothetical protein BIFGAL_04418 [Bifidobacterium gallicum DSM 20093 = LMG 11596]
MRFGAGNCSFADQLGQGRCGLGMDSASLRTGLVRNDAGCWWMVRVCVSGW